jgi:hypothetical protein
MPCASDRSSTHLVWVVSLFVGTTQLAAQSTAVVPAAHASSDAVRMLMVPGGAMDLRQQTIIGAAHLQGLVGRTLTAIEFRRDASGNTHQGGAAQLTVRLSSATRPPLEVASAFADNAGTSVEVFQGTIQFPTSPPAAGPVVPWTAANTVRIAFTTPYSYAGGPLCLDITGSPVAGQAVTWWPVDAECEALAATTTDLGGGCGAYGGANHEGAYVTPGSLVPGGHAHLFAHGTPFGLAIAAIGQRSPVGVPMSLLGFASPAGCDLHLATIDVLLAAVFVPDPHPMLALAGGRADVELKIPAIPQALGFTATAQWFDWSASTTSNAIEWTIAPSIPTLDMALVEGHALEATGTATVHLAHVMRFEYQ